MEDPNNSFSPADYFANPDKYADYTKYLQQMAQAESDYQKALGGKGLSDDDITKYIHEAAELPAVYNLYKGGYSAPDVVYGGDAGLKATQANTQAGIDAGMVQGANDAGDNLTQAQQDALAAGVIQLNPDQSGPKYIAGPNAHQPAAQDGLPKGTSRADLMDHGTVKDPNQLYYVPGVGMVYAQANHKATAEENLSTYGGMAVKAGIGTLVGLGPGAALGDAIAGATGLGTGVSGALGSGIVNAGLNIAEGNPLNIGKSALSLGENIAGDVLDVPWAGTVANAAKTIYDIYGATKPADSSTTSSNSNNDDNTTTPPPSTNTPTDNAPFNSGFGTPATSSTSSAPWSGTLSKTADSFKNNSFYTTPPEINTGA